MIREITRTEFIRLVQALNSHYEDYAWMIKEKYGCGTKEFVGDITDRKIPDGTYLIIYDTEEFPRQVRDAVCALGYDGFELCCIDCGDAVLILVESDGD